MQHRHWVDRYFAARERASDASIAQLESLEPRLLLAANPFLPKVRVKNAFQLEGDAGQFPNMVFKLKRNGDATQLAQKTVVRFSTSTLPGIPNAALQGADYLGKSGKVVFKPGQTRKRITVPIVGNNSVDPDRAFQLDIKRVKNGVLKGGGATGVINDDDSGSPQSTTPSITITDVEQNEGNAGTTTFNFTVNLSNAFEKPVTVQYRTSNGTGNAGAKVGDNDYESRIGELVFNPGETSKTISVTVNGDTKPELDEVFFVNLSAPQNAFILDAVGKGTILNEDGSPSLRINDVSITEGATGQTKKAVFTVTLSGALEDELTVDYNVTAGTATDGVDFNGASGTLTFKPGETSKTIEVDILGDNLIEPDETFNVVLSNKNLDDDVVVLTSPVGVGTIVNDDIAPAVSISDVTRVEGNTGTQQFVFTLTLDREPTETATVNYATADGTALQSDDDYDGDTGVITFAPGQTVQTLTIDVNGDTKLEPNETFFVNLFNPQKLTIADNQGQGTIVNDDLAAGLSINDPAPIVEGDVGNKNLIFTVTLGAVSGQPVTVNYATANGTATAGQDYVATSGTLTFQPGETTKQIVVPIIGDFNPAEQLNESFFVNLSNPTNATIAKGQGQGAITDNDLRPNINVSNAQGFSGTVATNNEEDGGQKFFRFTISLSQAVNQPVQVFYTTANGTATTADNDYVAKSGSVIIPAGETTAEVDVLANGDTKPEDDEIFFLNLTSAKLVNSNTDISSFIVDSQGVATIANDDGLPLITISDVVKAEGNSGTTTFSFTVSLSEATSRTVKVNYTTQDGDGVTGAPDPTPDATTFDQDYVAKAGTLIFNPGETSKTINITVNGDTEFEPQEVFRVVLSNPDEATIQDGTGIGFIVNDDSPNTVSINDVAITEGDSGSKNLTFTVTLQRPAETTYTVDWATSDSAATNTANAGVDYTASSGTLTFLAGQTSKTVTVSILGDATVEEDEIFEVVLSNPTGGLVLADATGIGTILNDD